jgi:Acyltransferase
VRACGRSPPVERGPLDDECRPPPGEPSLHDRNLEVVGEENLWAERPAVFVFNHQSSIDMPVLGALVRAT